MSHVLRGKNVDNTRIVGTDGYVSVRGRRVGQVIQLKRSRRWIYRAPGAVWTTQTWSNREEAVDALLADLQGGVSPDALFTPDEQV